MYTRFISAGFPTPPISAGAIAYDERAIGLEISDAYRCGVGSDPSRFRGKAGIGLPNVPAASPRIYRRPFCRPALLLSGACLDRKRGTDHQEI